ncbi:putative inactive purple acid phosphatase 29 [Leucoagaricus sp. SymC.cos]|nr:putative inactive purple acid phosphatase 29 [Leucoagaricus sp. SymC.cos]
MALSFLRLFRAVRSVCLPVTTVVGFCFLLTWIFILYQPTPGPGLIQRMGWQAWESVDETVSPSKGPSNTIPSEGSSTGSDGGNPDDVDWWNVTKTDDTIDYAGLPLDVWNPLLPHNTGLSEIAVIRCLVNPEIGADICLPDTTSEQDAIKGKWVRVEPNLNMEAGPFGGWLNIYYRRTRRQDINLITDIRLLPDKEEPFPPDGWKKADLSLRSGVLRAPPLYLWYKVGKPASEMSAEEKADLITEMDVTFGDDDPWYGFEKIEPPTTIAHGKVQSAHVSLRRGVKLPPKARPLHFSREGRFKILQVADLHFSVSPGACRDTELDCTGSDNMTTTLLSRVLDLEKPDLVVFTGDQLNGQGTSWDPMSVLAKFAKAVIQHKVPWTVVFGNHDEDDGVRKEAQVMLMKALPYSLVERGPKDIHGVGNYVLKVKSADPSKTHLLTLYFLDSGSYSKGWLDWFGFFNPTEYDYFRDVQSSSISQIERPFHPDTAKDLGHNFQARQGEDQLTPSNRRLAKPNALMFFHIPLPESYSKADIDPQSKKPLDVGISGQEDPGNAKKNGGMFEKGILKATESAHKANGNALEVKAIANGHCHITENCRRIKGIWLCFGGGSSYSGYGKIGFDRRFRVYETSDYGETIKTWKRTEHDDIVDEMILAGPGAAPLPS